MDTKRDTQDLDEADRRSMVALDALALVEAELMADPDNDFLWDLLVEAA